ncbi:MAG: GGDEF domain-containing protein, partial [Campylobacterota bacterium]|nr:GGDEF domain-containing protein [Campylobacterota bacterium]
MLSTLLDINDLPINVAIYKKVGDDFIFIDFNKKAEITESVKKNSLINKKLTEVFPGVKEFGLFDVLLRVD